MSGNESEDRRKVDRSRGRSVKGIGITAKQIVFIIADEERGMSEGVEASKEEDRFDPEFAEELELLAYTKDGQWIEVRIDQVDESEFAEAEVVFNPPVGEEFHKTMEVSTSPSEQTEFDRLLDATGQNYDTAKEMVDDQVRMRYVSDGWELKNTIDDSNVTETTSYIEEMVDTAKWGGEMFRTAVRHTFIFLLIAVSWPISGMSIMKESSIDDRMKMMSYFAYLLVWLVMVFGGYNLFIA